MAQTAEGHFGAITNNLQRMRELAVQAANGTNSQTDIAALEAEYMLLGQENQRVIATTTFNGQTLLNMAAGGPGFSFQVGPTRRIRSQWRASPQSRPPQIFLGRCKSTARLPTDHPVCSSRHYPGTAQTNAFASAELTKIDADLTIVDSIARPGAHHKTGLKA